MTCPRLLILTLFPALFLFWACASASGTFAPLDSSHPASAQAPETPIADPSAFLRENGGSLPAGEQPAGAAEAHGAGHAGAYVCPMHEQVSSDEPGRCPECGMKLVPRPTAEHPHEEHPHDG